MTGERPLDAIILGGGPAGAAAARCLAAWGRRVVLLSRADTGSAITESLPPSCLPLLDRIGVRRAVEETGFIRATGNTVWWAGDTVARPEPFAAPLLGFQVARDVFDAVLLREAELAGADVRRGALVRDVVLEPGRARVTVEERGGIAEIEAPWVLDCTGRTGLIARRGMRRTDGHARTLALIGGWESDDWRIPDDTHTLVESYANGWAWSVPITKERRCVTVMVDPSITSLAGRAGLEAAYLDELARTTHLSRVLSRATRTGEVWARDASAYDAHGASDDGILLVGDAASFVDPLSSFGVKKALASAWLAAVVVNTCLADGSMRSQARDIHDRRERAMHATLSAHSAALARDAASAHDTAFWHARTLDDVRASGEEIDVAALRSDPDVLSAFEALRQHDSLLLVRANGVGETPWPTVRGNRVVLEPHLVAPAFPEGIRYLRNVDLVMLSNLAPSHTRVPDLYESYNRSAQPVGLPDFLGALSVLVGKGLLLSHSR